MDKHEIYRERKANSSTIWILFIFLGWSYGSLGKIGLQIFYYLTLGGLGIWMLIRLFTLNGAIKEYNKNIAKDVGFTNDELVQLGLLT